MKRYAVFYGPTHSPSGGWDDYKGGADTITEAQALIAASDLSEKYNWWQVVDLTTGDIIIEGGS